MLRFTGERMIPGQVDIDLELEHVARYCLAARVTSPGTILDLACGAGYGSTILSRDGGRVVGIDIAPEAVAYCRAVEHEAAVSFLAGDGLRLPFADSCFDAVVAFEILEHVEDPERLLREAARVLRSDGVLILSTPDRDAYAEARGGAPNPYHVREFTADELGALLGTIFEEHSLLAQTRAEGALFLPLGQGLAGRGELAAAARSGVDFLVAICGSAGVLLRARARPYFHAGSLESVRRRDARIRQLQEEVEERSSWGRRLTAEVEAAGAQVAVLHGELESRTQWARRLEAEAREKEEKAAQLDRALTERTRRLRELEARGEEGRHRAELLQSRVELLSGALADQRLLAKGIREEREALAVGLAICEERLLALSRRLDDHIGALTPAVGGLEGRVRQMAESLEWHSESLGSHRRLLDSLRDALSPVTSEVDRLTEAEYSHGMALEHLARQVDVLSDRAELAETGQHHLEQLANENQAGLEHTHELTALMWRSAAWRCYRAFAVLAHRVWRSPARRLSGLREVWRDRRAARAERRRQVALLTAEIETRAIALPRTSAPQADVLLMARSGADTLRCLESLASSPARTAYQVTLVVNDPWFPVSAFTVLAGLRIARGGRDPLDRFQRLARNLTGGWVVYLDSGARVAADWLDRLVGTFRDFPSAGIVGVRVLDDQGRIVEQGGVVSRDGSVMPCRPAGDAADVGRAREVDYSGAACFAVERSLLSALGGFRPVPGSVEHRCADFAFRARAAGRRVYVQPTAVVRLSARPADLEDHRGDSTLRQAWCEVLDERPGVPDGEALRALLDVRPRFLVIDHRLPTPDQDSGSLRMSYLLRLLVELGYRVTFVPANLGRTRPYAEDLEAVGVEVVSGPADDSVDSYLERLGDVFELVLVSRAHIAESHLSSVRERCPSARVIFDTVDLQFLRLHRQANLEKDDGLRRRALEAKSKELGLARSADLTLVVSEVEKYLLANEAPDLEVRVLSNIHRVVGGRTSFEDRSGLLFIGGFEHPPNVDAVLWLVQEVLPRVHEQLPDVHACIIGSKPTAEVEALASDWVTIAGYVPNVTPYFERSRLSVAPLRYGAGVKGKVNQSLAHGLPCIATSCAAEGMGLTTEVDVLIADDAAAFATAIVRAYSDAALWRRLSEGGLRNTRERFSIAAARRDLEAILEELRVAGGSGERGSVLAFPSEAQLKG